MGNELQKNSERFLIAYNTIARELERLIGLNKYMPFYRLVDMAKKKNGVVMAYKDDLKELSHLRNAIVHDKVFPEYAIAEPHLSVVHMIEEIADELVKPKKLIPVFKKNVKVFEKKHSVMDVLTVIKEHGFSQFPIYEEGNFVGLITDRGITRWMANQLTISTEICLVGRVADVLSLEKNNRNYMFMNQDQTIYDAREKYNRHLDLYNSRLEAILITDTGKANETLLGMATPYDIINIHTSN